MSTNNDDLLRSLKLFEGKTAKKDDKKEEKLDEFKMKPTPDSKKGMFKGKTKAELRTELANVKKRMKSIEDSGKKVPKALRTKFSELTFALRAKHNWGTAESKEVKTKKKTVKESMSFESAIDKMLAENFWGGEEDGSQDGGSSGMGSSEQGGESPLGNGHEHDSVEDDSDSDNDHEDVLKIDVPTFLKFLEFAREDATGDDELHELAEKLVQCCGEGDVINMDKFEEICCMNHDGGEEVGANSEAGQDKEEENNFGGEENSGSGDSGSGDSGSGDSGSGSVSGEEESESKAPWSVAESMRVLINRLN